MDSKQSFQKIDQTPVNEQESTGLFSDTYRVRTHLSMPRTVLKKHIYYTGFPHLCRGMVSTVHKDLGVQVRYLFSAVFESLFNLGFTRLFNILPQKINNNEKKSLISRYFSI